MDSMIATQAAEQHLYKQSVLEHVSDFQKLNGRRDILELVDCDEIDFDLWGD